MNFDAIITTIYTYEFEAHYLKSPQVNVLTIKNYAKNNTKKHIEVTAYNQIKNNPPIWHMHGERRKKSSLILTHYEYAKLTEAILAYNRMQGNRYESFFSDFNIRSWIDYFIVADVYVVGLGYSYAEFDLWWLLNRRMRETNQAVVGSFNYFDMKSHDNVFKLRALENCGVNVIAFDNESYKNNGKIDFKSYYMNVIEKISEMSNNKQAV